jgi:RNA ligase (TIGR02306 family)
MSIKLATVEKILEVYPHPNADSLEFAKVLGYQCIVPKGKWSVGDFCILIQPDTVLPDAEWSKVYKSKSNRVKAIKLRGEWSFGIVESFQILEGDRAIIEMALPTEGLDVSQELGVIKYESPQPQDLNAKGGLPFDIPKTDEERFQNLNLEKYFGKSVDISLKIDGQSFTAFYKDGDFGVCGRTMEYKLDSDNNYTRNFKKYKLEEKLRDYCQKYGVNIALRGEQFGAGIQASGLNPHAKHPLNLMFFSCYDIDNRRYFSPSEKHYYRNVCEELELPTVPRLEKNVIFDKSFIDQYQTAEKTDEGNPFEGVVVVGEGYSFKIINLNYDSRK